MSNPYKRFFFGKKRKIVLYIHEENLNTLTNQNFLLSPTFSSYLSLLSLPKSNFYFFFGYLANKQKKKKDKRSYHEQQQKLL